MASDSDKILSLLIQLKVLGKEDARAAKELLDETTKGSAKLADATGDLTKKHVEIQEATKKTNEATEHETLKKRELREVIGHLTAGYPILGEVAKMALDPLVLAVASPALAFEIWKQRVDALTEALGGIEMPDLAGPLEQAKQLGQEWNGIAEAIAKANREFNSPESVFKRSEDTIEKQADADKKLNELNKKKALANLDLQKNGMTETQYEVARTGIENFYAQKEFNIDERTANKRLQAKTGEIFDANQDARNLDRKQQDIRLPQSKEEFDAGQEALKKRAEAFRKEAEVHAEEVKKVQDTQSANAEGGLGGILKSFPGFLRSQLVYGWGSTAGGIVSYQEKQRRDAEEKAAGVDAEIARRQKLFDEREKIRGEAAAAAGTAQTLNNEAPHEAENFRRDRATRAAVNKGQQEINVMHSLSISTDGGKHVEGATAAIRAALEQNNQAWLNAYKDLAKTIKALPKGGK